MQPQSQSKIYTYNTYCPKNLKSLKMSKAKPNLQPRPSEYPSSGQLRTNANNNTNRNRQRYKNQLNSNIQLNFHGRYHGNNHQRSRVNERAFDISHPHCNSKRENWVRQSQVNGKEDFWRDGYDVGAKTGRHRRAASYFKTNSKYINSSRQNRQQNETSLSFYQGLKAKMSKQTGSVNTSEASTNIYTNKNRKERSNGTKEQKIIQDNLIMGDKSSKNSYKNETKYQYRNINKNQATSSPETHSQTKQMKNTLEIKQKSTRKYEHQHQCQCQCQHSCQCQCLSKYEVQAQAQVNGIQIQQVHYKMVSMQQNVKIMEKNVEQSMRNKLY